MRDGYSLEEEQPARCFAPVVDANTRLLVLGSLPGRASLSAGRYYAHPQNQFWRLIGGVLGEELHRLAYEARLQRLLSRGVGLWDSVAEAVRPGSLDSAMQCVAANDLQSLVRELPRLSLIGFNGKAAAKFASARLASPSAVATAVLPSSSPALTTPFAEKLFAWRLALAPVLADL